jgi:ABC-type sugar transport system permease subunit
MAQVRDPDAPGALGAASVPVSPPATPAVVPAAGAAGTLDVPGTRRANLTPYLFLALPLALYLLWVIGPVVYTFYLSLTQTEGLTTPNWIGFDNYERLFGDRIFWFSFWNNVRWLVAYITIPTVCGLGLALLLNNNLPGTRFFKAGFFSPMVLSSVVIANVWGWMYSPRDGLINTTMELVGYDGRAIGWLGDYDFHGAPFTWLGIDDVNLVTYSIIGAGIWRQIGYVMLLYLAGLKAVDPSLVDASRTDGANAFQTFRDVVFPQLQPVTVIVVVISIIDALRAFDLVNLMTAGGPANRSNVLAVQMWREAFLNY